jgi:AraC-like DNA-binding protein
MKAQFHKLPLVTDTSFLFQEWNCPYFDKPWHFHREYELVLIEESRGTKFIGDNVSRFEEGDLFLLGSNLPHLFRNDKEYYEGDASLVAQSTFLHFSEDFLGANFFQVPEMLPVKDLLDHSALGLEVLGQTKKQIITQLHHMKKGNSSQRLLGLLNILFLLAESNEIAPLLTTRFAPLAHTNSKDTNRIDKILEFIMQNYTQEIYVSEIAARLNMSDASFSRYFKHHTHKSFSSYVTEIRISHACRLLMQGEESIAQIGFLSGFENLSNFYRHFRKITGLVPKEYRSRFMKTREALPLVVAL